MTFLLLTDAFDMGAIFKTVVTKWYYYVIFAVFIALLVLFLTLKKRPERNALNKTGRIAYTAVLTALCVIANVFDIKVSDAFQISLVATVGFVSGYLLGGGYGFAACFIGDLIGAIINPHGAYNPIIGIGTGLWGLIPGLVFSFPKGNDYLKLVISFLISSVVISGIVNTLGIYLMYGLGKAYLAGYPWKLAMAAVNFALSAALLAVLPRVLPKDKFFLTEQAKNETESV